MTELTEREYIELMKRNARNRLHSLPIVIARMKSNGVLSGDVDMLIKYVERINKELAL
jgi:hypothetical protein